jgi:uncharacterized protein (TIGR02452 family)
MNRSTRSDLAKRTLEIIERGSYTTPAGRVAEIGGAVRACVDATRYYPPEELESVRQAVPSRPSEGFDTALEVANETTLAGIARMLSDGHAPVAALNFASAKNPGGGFLGGSQAQEESLARSSALYVSLVTAHEYYERHRRLSSSLYSDAMILSPNCPIIRDDAGALLEEPRLATFITSAAPNAGALAANRCGELQRVPDVLRRRSEYVLALAASHGYRNLVLGAWGYGVFRNDPKVVASTFFDHLRNGAWAGRFERIVFSVRDSSPSLATLAAFQSALRDR